ncbi:pyridoxamine 5'-phosphate oxidase-domain-containing protein [Thamnocephalis sphaerospora]|uniref:Pyridoxamine 5'-phosphate oxidase-domain-containing protein n=1 Tax=Thamnocephalis sphaerospora TaxID=78915 RepID=A0A4P9XXD0_9FUNG|nr:pyridoxamine 5'-phosphate oxidase-domain-containing protein [Thamnocephalis sphaerospora]|eukprot:RKP10967.1 pyridoxamine 5'-phosphate oxidase-domain-containing protein [Thamnocephalis sphaerospora]
MESSMLAPPWKQPLLRSLARCLQQSGASAGFMQLATVNADSGLPECRTVGFRGFLLDTADTRRCVQSSLNASETAAASAISASSTGVMRFTSDARTNKVRTMLQRPVGELCWYHAATVEQYRLSVYMFPIFAPGDPRQPDLTVLHSLSPELAASSGHATVTEQLYEERERMWHEATSDSIRASLAWPPPGQTIDPALAADSDWMLERFAPRLLTGDEAAERTAYQNFVLVLAMPWRVDRVELAVTPFRRTEWRVGQHGLGNGPGADPESAMREAGCVDAWTMVHVNP